MSSDEEDEELLLLYDVTRSSLVEEQDNAALFGVAAILAVIVGASPMRVARKKRSQNVDRDHAQGFHTIYHDYFANNPVYSAASFSCHFSMDRDLFLMLMMV